ncbi:MAG: hypothetical protein HGA76_08235, partial [Candidatus Firestonebacteria bacterium]|nr:hypothetical protein [Candidatus Firestonebacteria bacterium]
MVEAKAQWFDPPYVPGEVLVQWVDNPANEDLVTEAQRLGMSAAASTGALHTALIASLGARSRTQHEAINNERLALPAGLTVEQAVVRFKTARLVK